MLDGGRLVQVGRPEEVYERPADLSVARLTGPACVLDLDTPARLRGDATAEIVIGAAGAVIGYAARRPASRLLVRPDWAVLGGPFPALAARVRYRGPHTDYGLKTPAGRLDLRVPGPPKHTVGEHLTWSLTRAWPLPEPIGGDDLSADRVERGSGEFPYSSTADIVN